MTEERSNPADRQQKLRQLAHDVRGHLAAVTMGLEALKLLRDDEDQFLEVYQTVRDEGIEPLKVRLGELVRQACELDE